MTKNYDEAARVAEELAMISEIAAQASEKGTDEEWIKSKTSILAVIRTLTQALRAATRELSKVSKQLKDTETTRPDTTGGIKFRGH